MGQSSPRNGQSANWKGWARITEGQEKRSTCTAPIPVLDFPSFPALPEDSERVVTTDQAT